MSETANSSGIAQGCRALGGAGGQVPLNHASRSLVILVDQYDFGASDTPSVEQSYANRIHMKRRRDVAREVPLA